MRNSVIVVLTPSAWRGVWGGRGKTKVYHILQKTLPQHLMVTYTYAGPPPTHTHYTAWVHIPNRMGTMTIKEVKLWSVVGHSYHVYKELTTGEQQN